MDCSTRRSVPSWDAIKNGGNAPVPSSQILYNQAIIDGIVKSAEKGREIEIQIPAVD